MSERVEFPESITLTTDEALDIVSALEPAIEELIALDLPHLAFALDDLLAGLATKMDKSSVARLCRGVVAHRGPGLRASRGAVAAELTPITSTAVAAE